MAVARKDHGPHGARVLEFVQQLAVDCIPYFDGLVYAPGCNPRSVWGIGHGLDPGERRQLHFGGAFLVQAKQLLTGSFMDYGLPRADNLPAFDTTLMEDPTHGNPLRIKGGGESGVVPASAAVINALCDALGVDDVPMPATPERVWRAIQEATGG